MEYKCTASGEPRTDRYVGTIQIENGLPKTARDIDAVSMIKEECRRRNADIKSVRLKCGLHRNTLQYRWRWKMRGRKADTVIKNRGIAYCMPLELATEADVYMYKEGV
jgi:hypothetical protein